MKTNELSYMEILNQLIGKSNCKISEKQWKEIDTAFEKLKNNKWDKDIFYDEIRKIIYNTILMSHNELFITAKALELAKEYKNQFPDQITSDEQKFP